MAQRKVGQDMVVRKQPVQKTRVVSSTPKPSSIPDRAIKKTESVITQPVQKPRETIAVVKKIIPNQKNEFTQTAGFHSKKIASFPSHQPPARGGVMWVFASIAVIGLVFTVLSLITRATIDLVLPQATYAVNQQIMLHTEPTEGQIGLKTARIVDSRSMVVPSTSKESTSTRATGTVKLFSTDTKSIALPLGTLLTSSQGKTFTTQSKVTLPAGTTQKPGSVEVSVIATDKGSDYNIALDDLTLSKFPQVIARTIAPITGGASGDVFTLTEAELAAAKVTLQARIATTNPAAFLANQIPENFLLPESLIQISDLSYTTQPTDAGVSVTVERTITGNMIDKESLEQFLKNTFIPESDRGFMNSINSNNLTFELPITAKIENTLDKNQETNTSENISLAVYTQGTFMAQAQIDESNIRQKIAHQKKADAQKFLSEIPGMMRSSISIWPPWISRVPAKVSAITFAIHYENK